MSLFELGHVVATPGVLTRCQEANVSPSSLIERHSSGDWEDLDTHDRRENRRALEEGTRIFSSYQTSAGRVWVITEADRSSTCLLLPEEY
jgi:hypothetical protein